MRHRAHLYEVIQHTYIRVYQYCLRHTTHIIVHVIPHTCTRNIVHERPNTFVRSHTTHMYTCIALLCMLYHSHVYAAHRQMHTCTCTSRCTYRCIYLRACIHTNMYIKKYVHMYHVISHTCIRSPPSDMRTYMYAYKYMYIYVHTFQCKGLNYSSLLTLQHTAMHCNTLQHTATHCNTLQHTQEKFSQALYWKGLNYSTLCRLGGTEGCTAELACSTAREALDKCLALVANLAYIRTCIHTHMHTYRHACTPRHNSTFS